MNILSLFHKHSPEDIYDELALKIITSSFMFPDSVNFIKETDVIDEQKINSGKEIVYFLLHILDRETFQMLGQIDRDKLINEVTQRTISGYCKTVLKEDTPLNFIKDMACHMLDTFNERTILYHRCQSVIDEKNPFSAGTMVFALSFYIHKALGLTNRDDVDDMLCGKRKFEKSDMSDFPMFTQELEISIYLGNILSKWQINKTLKHLR